MQENISKAPPSGFVADLEELLKFESLLADLSARFVNLRTDQVDQEIERAQREICDCLRLDHSSLWQLLPGPPRVYRLTHLYRDPNLTPVPERVDGDTYFPWAQRKIEAKEIICIPRTAEAPLEAVIDKSSWEAFHLKSTLGFPLWVGDGPAFGVLSFDATMNEREWQPHLVKRLQLLAQVFANTLARKRYEQALRENETRLRLAADSAGAGLWTLDPVAGQLWATDKTKEIFGLGSADEMDLKRFLTLVHPEDCEKVRHAIEEAFKSGQDTRVEYRIIRPDKQVRWIAARGRRRSGEFSEADKLMGVSTDITERKEAEDQLRKSYAEIKELKEKVEAESGYLQEEIKLMGSYDEIVGRSKALKQVLKKVEQVAQTDSVVLIIGETGTGKELIARAIHNLSKRRERAMVKLDCAALPPTLIESELFGRERGAYTGALSRQLGRFETADNSTLFMDEIGELGVELQSKLLRVVQEGDFERLGGGKTIHVDVRLIAATHRDLEKCVASGSFRQDLFYRLNVFPIRVPPLRERMEDIPMLTTAFVREFSKKIGKNVRVIPNKVMDELRRYSWPGNIRELRNLVERAVIVSIGEKLKLEIPRTANSEGRVATLKQAEYEHILATLERTGWRIKGHLGAASLLGMKPSTLYTTMRRLHIPNRHERGGMRS